MPSDLHDEYRDMYCRELSRRAELASAIERPLAVITALVGVLYFCFQDVTPRPTLLDASQGILGLVIGGLLVAAIIEVVRSNYDHTYRHMPTPKDLEDFKARLIAHHIEDRALSPADIDSKVLDHLRAAYIEGCHDNTLVNEYRSKRLHAAKKYIIYSLGLILVLAVLRVCASSYFTFWLDQLRQLGG